MRYGIGPGVEERQYRYHLIIMSSDTDVETDVSADLVFDLLSSQRRRMVLYYLRQSGAEMTVKEISQAIAANENDIPVDELSRQQRKRVYVSLYQTHLPKLADAGVIDYDRENGVIRLTGRGEEIDQYLDPAERSEYPWAIHYLVLGALGLVLVSLSLLPESSPFQLVPFWVGLGLTVLLALSAVVHYWDYRRKARRPFVRGSDGDQ